MNLSTAKQVKTRDAATALLRKLGLARQDYDDFICRRDGAFYVDLLGAAAEAAKPAAAAAVKRPVKDIFAGLRQAAASEQLAQAAPARLTPPSAGVGRPGTISATARAALLAGQTNDEVWAALVAQHQLPESRKGYPAWYRSELRRKGHQI